MRCCGGWQSHLTSSLISWASVAGGRTRSAPALVPGVREAWGRDPGALGEQTGRAGWAPAFTLHGRRARGLGLGASSAAGQFAVPHLVSTSCPGILVGSERTGPWGSDLLAGRPGSSTVQGLAQQMPHRSTRQNRSRAQSTLRGVFRPDRRPRPGLPPLLLGSRAGSRGRGCQNTGRGLLPAFPCVAASFVTRLSGTRAASSLSQAGG